MNAEYNLVIRLCHFHLQECIIFIISIIRFLFHNKEMIAQNLVDLESLYIVYNIKVVGSIPHEARKSFQLHLC